MEKHNELWNLCEKNRQVEWTTYATYPGREMWDLVLEWFIQFGSLYIACTYNNFIKKKFTILFLAYPCHALKMIGYAQTLWVLNT